MQKDSEIRTQVEYYLSDANLQKDAFFYGKIKDDKEGYLDLDLIMNCNKIKAQGITKDAIKAAVKESRAVELDSTGQRIRRKNNKALPEPKFKQRKPKTNSAAGGNFYLIK
jgi:hypothetical protein